MNFPEFKDRLKKDLERLCGKPLAEMKHEFSKTEAKAIPFHSNDAAVEVVPSHHKILDRILDSTPTDVMQSWGLDGPFWFVSFIDEPAVAFHFSGMLRSGYIVVTEWTKPGWYSCTLLDDDADKRLAVVAVKGLNLGFSINDLIECGNAPKEVYQVVAYTSGIVDLRNHRVKAQKDSIRRDLTALNKIYNAS